MIHGSNAKRRGGGLGLKTVVTFILAGLALTSLTACGSQTAEIAEDPGIVPAVTGQVGSAPTIHPGTGKPNGRLQVRVLHQGSGRVVQRDDQIVVNYQNQRWSGQRIENTYKSGGSPLSVALPQTITGWQKALLGKKVGARVLVVVPPADGYQLDAKAKETPVADANNTLVFVIDILDAASRHDVSALKNAKKIDTNFQKIPNWVKYSGKPGEKPTLAAAANAGTPNQKQLLMLYEGTGEAMQADEFPLVHVTQIQFVDGKWSAETSTWDQQTLVSTPETIQLTEHFLGVHVGSRLLKIEPFSPKSTQEEGHPGRVVIYDVAGKLSTGK